MSEKLQKIAEIELAGERFDLARNGRFRLVRSCGPDAYGRPVAEVLAIEKWIMNRALGLPDPDRVQALLDALGEAYVRLQGQRDLRHGEKEIS